MKIALACDHGGFDLRNLVKDLLEKRDLDVEDLGPRDRESTDYPDYADEVASRVSHGEVDEGILICTTGVGMTIAANKYPRVRAAHCINPLMSEMSRRHNDANILVLGAKIVADEDVEAILDAWFANSFEGDRHERRLKKMRSYTRKAMETASVAEEDPEICKAILSEWDRQQKTINLIASENYISRAAREAQGSILTNKYAEGLPSKRWYQGCNYIDDVETLAIDRAKELFNAEHANVQPHCGTSANMAVYFSVLTPGDTIMAMDLSHGGHLSHGNPVNFSGRLFNIAFYGVSKETEQIDYDNVAELALKHKPKLIVAGASAYSRTLDFKRFREIADSVGAYLLVDMAHIAGLVAAGSHPAPFPYADFVTTTTHKTLRGSRGGLILCKEKYAADIDKNVFPGMQGGPLMHAIAAKAVCFNYALKDEFKDYGHQIVKNAKVIADSLLAADFRLVSGGTDNHLMMIDLDPMGITGRDAAARLEKADLIVNKNSIPFSSATPFVTSGIRLGTPMVTTRGMKEPEMKAISGMIADVLKNMDSEHVLKETLEKVRDLATRFPVKMT